MQQIIDIIKEKNAQGIPVYIMPIGLPGCGKSTLADQLQAEANIEILGYDALTEEFQRTHNLSYSEAFAQMPFEQKKEKFMERRNALIDSGANIFADATNLSGVMRGKVLDEIPQYFQIGVYFPLSIQDSLERCARREEETGKHVPQDVIEGMVHYINVPDPEEFDVLFYLKNDTLKLNPVWDRDEDFTSAAPPATPDALQP